MAIVYTIGYMLLIVYTMGICSDYSVYHVYVAITVYAIGVYCGYSIYYRLCGDYNL